LAGGESLVIERAIGDTRKMPWMVQALANVSAGVEAAVRRTIESPRTHLA
jgi:hypothetical protein